jgi:hypothetical protein
MVKITQLVKFSISLVLIFSVAFFTSAQSESDIMTASVSYEDSLSEATAGQPSPKIIKLSNFQKITDSPSYTNQPYFINGDTALAYTQMITSENTSQTDIFIYDFATQSSTNLSNSPTSEYSPTPTPEGKGLSVIRVNSQGKQQLWYLQLGNGKAKINLLPAVEPVGYHVWDGAKKVLLFVLGEPQTLRSASINKPTEQGTVLDINIGPSLWSIPDSNLFSYSKKIDETTWQLRSVDTKKKTTAALVNMPVDSYYFAWSPVGYAVTAVENKLYQWHYTSAIKTWTEFADLSTQCPAGISRLSFSEKGDKIALVCNHLTASQ